MRYDQVYKSIFSHSIAVEHLLRFAARMIDDGPGCLAAFDPETLEQVPTERIDETLHRHLSDLVWRVRLRERGEEDWAYLFVLIEFQSAVDHLMALRVRTYMDLLYRGLWRERRFGAWDRLPPVLPVVLYNGASPWTAAASVEDLVSAEGRPAGLAGPVALFAGSRYLALDVVPGIGSCAACSIRGSVCWSGLAPAAPQSRGSRRWSDWKRRASCGQRFRTVCAHGVRRTVSRDVNKAARRASNKSGRCCVV